MYRIRETYEGFIAEHLIYKWTLFGIKKQWKPFLCYYGNPNEVYHYSSCDSAEKSLLQELKWLIIKETKTNF